MGFNINTDAAVVFTNKLEKMSKSALPYAVRTALNSAAFDVKKNTMPKSADDHFEKRKPNFFKANSKVEVASGKNVFQMKATIGMFSNNLKGKDNYAVKDLEQQEEGGVIKGRSIIALKAARSGKSWGKVTRNNARIAEARTKFIDAKKAEGATDKQKFNHARFKGGEGSLIISTFKNKNGNRIVYKVVGKKNIPFYALKSKRQVTPKATHFMRDASLESGEKIEEFFIEKAKQLIK